MIYNRFDVCFAEVQFEDKGVSRDRPVIIMQDMGDYAICLKCTTNLKTPVYHQHIQMLPEAGLHQETTIVLKSYIKLFKDQIRVKTGHLDIYDIASLQARLDEHKNEMKLQEKLVLNESLFEEYNESDNNLTEAKKKRKKKKISQINPGEAIFKSVRDMQKWVKKRQKGMGYFVHMDCGNMDYNNDMFNKMHGLGDTSSSSTTDGGASDAAPSGGEASVGMGESLEINEVREPKPDRSFVETAQFQNSWKQNGLNDEDLRDLQNKIMTEPPEADLQGGLYKFRFAPKRESRGQREAYRTIYYDFQGKKTIYLLYCFPKQEKANLSETQLKYLRELSKLIRGRK